MQIEGTARKPWQVGLRTVFLFTAAIAVWVAVFINRTEIATLKSRVAAMRPLARELVIDDETKVAVVKLQEMWYDENAWEIHLPEGVYRLHLATRGIDREGFVPGKCVPIAAGRHRLILEQTLDREIRRITVSVDGIKLLEEDEPKSWNPELGSAGGGLYAVSTLLPADRAIELFRRRFTLPNSSGQVSAPVGPTDGILLWIEP